MVTFRDREAAILQWTGVAATIADAETTRRAMGRGAIEYGCWPADVGQEYEDAPTEVS
jgi:hypothetical protein